MKFFAVIDTNVIVSALLNWGSVPGTIVDHMIGGRIIPIVSTDIIKEYVDVLKRRKFSFPQQDIQKVIKGISDYGLFITPGNITEVLPDPKDVVFYAVTMEARKDDDVFLVTGNTKHFPTKPFVVTPREMLTIIENSPQ